MSLFPAYVDENLPKENLGWSMDIEKSAEWDMASSTPVSPGAEVRLLQSDSDDENVIRAPSPKQARSPALPQDFYVDKKMDRGNLRVSTLYYPGRPDYRERALHRALGTSPRAKPRAAPARYFTTPAPPADDAAEAAARTAALQARLLECPQDLRMWLHLIYLQQEHLGAGPALAAAQAGLARWPRCGPLLAACCRLLPAACASQPQLTQMRGQESSVGARRLISRHLALLAARSPGALRDMLLDSPDADLLPVYAWYLRSAGHWERLTQLVELAATLYYPPTEHFPKATELTVEDQEKLEDYEDKVIHSGLPMTAVWYRVERARAAAHWRPAGGGAAGGGAAADEERSPRESETAALLPTSPPPPHVLLEMAQIPMFGLYSLEPDIPPAPLDQLLLMLDAAMDAGEVGDAGGGAGGRAGGVWGAAGGGAVQKLLREFADPPTYLANDDYGFTAWISGLWLALATWGTARARTAAAAHALRWLRATLAAGVGAGEGCGARVGAARTFARRLLRVAPQNCALLAVEFSLLEARAAILVGEPLTRAARAARAAAGSRQQDPAEALYVARRAGEVLRIAEGAGSAGEARALLLRAVADNEHDALRLILEKSSEIERELDLECSDVMDIGVESCSYEQRVLPGEAEWGAARELLKPRELSELIKLHASWSLGTARCRRYCGTAARALPPRARAALAPLYPHDHKLQLAAAREPTWRGGAGGAGGPGVLAVEGPSNTKLLALALPHLLRGVDDPVALERAHRILSRGWSATEDELAGRVALRAAGGGRADAVLPGVPQCKWVYVSAGAGGGDVHSLQALMLDCQLRLRALWQELRPVRQ